MCDMFLWSNFKCRAPVERPSFDFIAFEFKGLDASLFAGMERVPFLKRKFGDSPADLIKSTKVFIATPQAGRRLGTPYHTPEQVSNPEPLDSWPGVDPANETLRY